MIHTIEWRSGSALSSTSGVARRARRIELHEDSNNASATQAAPTNDIEYARVALTKNDPSTPRLHDEDYNDYDQEQCDQTDGYRPIGLLHILDDEIREGI